MCGASPGVPLQNRNTHLHLVFRHTPDPLLVPLMMMPSSERRVSTMQSRRVGGREGGLSLRGALRRRQHLLSSGPV